MMQACCVKPLYEWNVCVCYLFTLWYGPHWRLAWFQKEHGVHNISFDIIAFLSETCTQFHTFFPSLDALCHSIVPSLRSGLSQSSWNLLSLPFDVSLLNSSVTSFWNLKTSFLSTSHVTVMINWAFLLMNKYGGVDISWNCIIKGISWH